MQTKLILCLLQNAWGDYNKLPIIFRPNPNNKSAKTIRKMVGKDPIIHFSNTTPVVTSQAAGKAPIDHEHMDKLWPMFSNYDLVLICGAQAAKAYFLVKERKTNLSHNIMVVPHPASRSLSNIQISEINKNILKKLS